MSGKQPSQGGSSASQDFWICHWCCYRPVDRDNLSSHRGEYQKYTRRCGHYVDFEPWDAREKTRLPGFMGYKNPKSRNRCGNIHGRFPFEWDSCKGEPGHEREGRVEFEYYDEWQIPRTGRSIDSRSGPEIILAPKERKQSLWRTSQPPEFPIQHYPVVGPDGIDIGEHNRCLRPGRIDEYLPMGWTVREDDKKNVTYVNMITREEQKEEPTTPAPLHSRVDIAQREIY